MIINHLNFHLKKKNSGEFHRNVLRRNFSNNFNKETDRVTPFLGKKLRRECVRRTQMPPPNRKLTSDINEIHYNVQLMMIKQHTKFQIIPMSSS